MAAEEPIDPPSACQNKEEAIMNFKRVLQLNSDLDHDTILLWAAQTYMRGFLPSNVCLYLAFDGAKSSGKTTATRASVYIAHNGEMITSITPSALKRMMDGGETLGIDEIDAKKLTNDALGTILRMGNSWDAKAKLSERKGNQWEVVETNIGGPKVFNFRGEIDDALGPDALSSVCHRARTLALLLARFSWMAS